MEELKQQKIWVCWRYEMQKGRRTKVLYNTKGYKTGTSKKYKSQWTTFEEATEAMKAHAFDGIGLVLPHGIGGIDLDHVDVDSELAQEVRALMNTYEEVSPSGKGIHHLFKVDVEKIPSSNGKLSSEYYSKNPHNQMEIYIGGLTNRYLTFTGNAISNHPVMDRTNEVINFLNGYMKKDSFIDSEIESAFVNDDFDIIVTARKAKNGDKFMALFDKGDITEYGSPSEADQALCNILAFYTGGDMEQMDSLFRQSKLYREKWERDDYRTSTIEKAIEGCHGKFYTGSKDRLSYIYYDERSKRMRVNCPLLASYIRENLHYIFVRDSAKGGVLRYVYEDGCYRLYADEMLKGIIKSYITAFDENILQMRDVNEVFGQITTDLAFTTNEELNADEDIINFQNGILRVSNMTLMPHSPDIKSTIQIPCNWLGVPKPTPVFNKFMHTLTNGDKAVENLLLEFIGVCLSNVKGWRMKKSLFMVGKGDTGKSQLKSLTESLLGKGNYIGIDLKEIESRFGTGNIYNKRLAGSSDMSFMSIYELKTFKKCTGGDSLFAEFKGQNGFEFTYNGLLWFCMNRLPKFGGDDGEWVYNRIMQVDCNNVIPRDKQDKQLLDKLYAERDGIVYKAILALKQVIANGYSFSEPQCVTNARVAYMKENNTVISFFKECMEERPLGKIRDSCTTGKVYDVYKAWCLDNNHGYSKTAKEFRTELANYLETTFSEMTVRRGKGGTFYQRYTLTDEAKNQYQRAYGYDELPLLS
ncbi:phage/plasmid primase, P4 family [Robertmurraya andreesenii]|uniref:P4 family phage/plasmid primase-like protein n=1 Tax=Anoxybacillus andreesenii TaxID=1325932 RepID=A0ABT9UZK8_9BACL|nr:phage/plasmid primase, P4 family [Robertmurraya andreesenii]MDQ0154130.1 P4 family phage/plasmid primase-like protein [Robertmurraya andreesenii]